MNATQYKAANRPPPTSLFLPDRSPPASSSLRPIFVIAPTMEPPSTSQLPAADTEARMAIRQRPQIHVAPHGPPSHSTWVQFRHPANNLTFLRLPTFDWRPPIFGIHYGTAITACQILACNEDGYLSTSRHRHARGRINVDLDSVIPPGTYYYHISSQKPEALYPICCDFPLWKFPHGQLPPAWRNEPNWSAISERVKLRDTRCLISESQDCLATSHVVPRIHQKWVRKMLVFDVGLSPICHFISWIGIRWTST